MQKVAELLNVIGTIGECFWIYCIIDILFERRVITKRFLKNKWGVILSNIIFAALIILIMNQQVLTSPWTMIVWVFYVVISACVFWKTELLSAMAVAGTYCLGILVVGIAEISLTGVFGGSELIELTTMRNGWHRVVYLLICIPVWWALNLFLTFWLKKKISSRNSLRYWTCLSFVGIVGSAFIASQLLADFSVEISIIGFLFIIILLMFLYGMFLLQKSSLYKSKVEFLEKNNELMEKSYDQISRIYSENAKIYHDMRHYLNAIYRLLKQDDKRAEEYLEQILMPLDMATVTNRTGIEILNVIFQEMDMKSQERNLKMDFDVQQLPQDIMISRKDLCALFVNLLENAVEAARSIVYVNVRQIHKMLFIQIRNDYIVPPKVKDGKFQTTKADGEKHGWGTQIVEQIVQKYDGKLEYSIDENYVNIEAMLNDVE